MIDRGEDQTDWARVKAMTDEEIEAAVKDDPDWEGFDDTDWSQAVWVEPSVNEAVTIRPDKDIADFFAVDTPGYQSRINDALRYYLDHMKKAAE